MSTRDDDDDSEVIVGFDCATDPPALMYARGGFVRHTDHGCRILMIPVGSISDPTAPTVAEVERNAIDITDQLVPIENEYEIKLHLSPGEYVVPGPGTKKEER